ncbi:hypothetical protein MNBD_UNCLBAC01-700 [hydrothermal vent metagenome]|uniref:Uncharacterized protein n=1 Tax=hydrothermal vent metagenome TaxID=652676 RepID=A0A3B1CYR6_9ZZZZ
MKSALIQKKYDDLVEACRSMTPEERLVAFSNHSQLMDQLRYSGKKHSTKKSVIQKNYES